MIIEGIGDLADRFANAEFATMSRKSSYDDFSDLDAVIPPEIGMLDQLAIKQFLPSAQELQQTVMAGAGVGGGIVIGLGVERFLGNNISMIPRGAYPFVHVGLGAIGGKLISGWAPAAGVGFAAGMAGLGVIRFLQSYLGMDISLSAALAGADLASLNDLMGDDDLLPPELQGLDSMTVEDRPMSQIPSDVSGYGNVVVEERSLSGWTYG